MRYASRRQFIVVAAAILAVGAVVRPMAASGSQDASMNNTAPDLDLSDGITLFLKTKALIGNALCRLSLAPSAKAMLRAVPQLTRREGDASFKGLIDIRVEPDQTTRPFGFPLLIESTTGMVFRAADDHRVVQRLARAVPGFEAMSNGIRAPMLDKLRGVVPEKEEEVLAAYAEQTREWFAHYLAPRFFAPMVETVLQTWITEFGGNTGYLESRDWPSRFGTLPPRSWPGHSARLSWDISTKAWRIDLRGTLDYARGRPMFSDFFEGVFPGKARPAYYDGVSSLYPATATPVEIARDPKSGLLTPISYAPSGSYVARMWLMPGYLLIEARLVNEDRWHFETLPLEDLFRRGWPTLERERAAAAKNKEEVTPRLATALPGDGGWSVFLFQKLPHLLSNRATHSTDLINLEHQSEATDSLLVR